MDASAARVHRTVLFADLRGSTALYQALGNAAAARLVTQTVQSLAHSASAHGGRVVKTLGDGLMVLFENASQAVQAAIKMQELLVGGKVPATGAPSTRRPGDIRLHVALEHGEVIELGDDCYGDAVNVAARLLDHSGDEEVLVTAAVLQHLEEASRRAFRGLDAISLRGRVQPVEVFACTPRSLRDGPTTWVEQDESSDEPDGIRLWSDADSLVLGIKSLPALLGRSPQAQFRVDEGCASRTHARLELRGHCIHLTDLSFNGTHVRFSDGELVTLRRSSCVLHGRGTIGLGRLPEVNRSCALEFELLRFAMTEPGA